MELKTCSSCGKEYYLFHKRNPYNDEGYVFHCDCGHEIFSYGKGTDDYTLVAVDVYKERLQRIKEEEAKYPICYCGIKMVPQTGPYGKFFGCAKFPNGCKKTVKR
ncbi:hypothetical protein [Bacillus cereus]|uniref:hypothetical protein n=1 Tax=Bacillus cereus TaxID=1396 RepID=UPI000BFC56DD|nr:hypothetical protein [Bacillus cereus]MDR4442198.1 hypothetical protein [Bacillus cereus]PGY84627.1 hypothetical protein COE36_16755 [Bacillus cereus]